MELDSGFQEAIRTCLGKYVTWQGRASRSEYWYFVLFNAICLIAATLLDRLLGTSFKMTNPANGLQVSMPYGYIYSLVALGLFLPNVAVIVRRFHDGDRSGWWYWFVLVPFIGAIMILVWFCSRGTPGDNRYGTDSLGGGYAETFS
jgi:uncharacterized membrane protein YhaH (DUF805 family)